MQFIELVLAWLNMRGVHQQMQFLSDHLELVGERTLEILADLIEQYTGRPQEQHDLRLAREIIRYGCEHGTTATMLQDAYINANGGFVLPLQGWLQRVIDQDDALQQHERPDQVAPARIALWQEALVCAQEECVALPIIAEIAAQLYSRWNDFLGADQSRAIEECLQALIVSSQIYTQEVYPNQWAMIQNNLGNAYANRVAASKAADLEQAIQCYMAALLIHTRDSFPEQWAVLQNNLGTTYFNRIIGNRMDNLEQAISCYEAALLVHSRSAFPKDWANAQCNLGLAYADRIVGNRIDNLEYAIQCYEAALLVYTRDAFPGNWAMTQNSLGTAFKDRSTGDRTDNLERAISCYEAALLVYTRNTLPTNWAMVQINLGLAYAERMNDTRMANLERAIEFYEAALLIYTRDTFSERWAKAQNNLGITYTHRIADSRTDNLERAISYHEAALLVYTRDAFPEQWANAQTNLGSTYTKRVAGRQAENLERAIVCYEAALEIFTRDTLPGQWAATQNNLGNAYKDRIAGNRTENLEQAIQYLEAALLVYTRDAFPLDWAKAQNNLGNVYSCRLVGKRADNLEQALVCYEAALLVHTRDVFPRECQQTGLNAASALAELHRWPTMQSILRDVLAIEDQLFAEAADLHSQEAILQEGRDVALQAAAVAAQMGDLEEAIVTVESGRARSLAQARQMTFADPVRIHDPVRRERYLAAREAMTATQLELRWVVGNPGYLDQLAIYQQCKRDFDALITEIETARDPADFLHQHVTLDDVRQAIAREPEGHALVYLLPTVWGGIALGAFTAVPTLSISPRILALPLPQLLSTTLDMLIQIQSPDTDQRLMGGYAHAQEGSGYAILLSWPGDTLHQKANAMQAATNGDRPSMLILAVQSALALLEYQDWADVLLDTLDDEQIRRIASTVNCFFLQLEIQRNQRALAEVVMQPVAAWLQEEGVTSVTLIPCGSLAAFPLLTTPLREVNGEIETFGDRFAASIAPSALSLLHGDRTHHRAGVASLGNPTPNHQSLEWGEAEALMMALLSGENTRYKIRYDATRDWFLEQVRTALVFDVSCHGFATGEDFLAYHLRLANGETVTLRDALDGVADLHGLRLLILSACQTGIVNLRGATSEMRSLAVGFIQAGASAVMAALWSVDDLATYLLMVRFAQEWFPVMEYEPPAAALARAQRWLRTVTWAELQAWNSQDVLTTISATASADPEVMNQTELIVGTDQLEKAIRRTDVPNARDAIDIDTCGLRMDGMMADEVIAKRAKRRSRMQPNDRPFADPYYWAAFQITGW